MSRAKLIDKRLEEGVNALVRYGIRFSIRDGEIYIDWRDWKKYDRLCDEGKLPRIVC